MMFTVQLRRIPCFFDFIVLTHLFNSIFGLVRGENGLSLVVEPVSSIIRNGTLLQINCTIRIGQQTNLSLLSPDNLTWSHHGSPMTSSTHVLDNKTLQLSIMNALWENSGQYWCRVRGSDDISEVNASVIIGDAPSAPQIVKWENQQFKLKLYWKAPSYDGRLPLTYSVKTPHKTKCLVSGLGNLTKSDGLYIKTYDITFYIWCKLWIEAENDVGSSKSDPINIKLTYSFETMRACPPVIKSVRSQTRAILIQLGTALKECTLVVGAHIYNISYREAGKSHLESKLIGPTSQTMLRLEPLKPFTQYYVYISVQLKDLIGELSIPSSVVGPLVASTKEEAPGEGPTDVNCSSAVWPNNRGRMNVTVEWKPPPYSQRNGIIRHYRLMDSNQRLVAETTSSTTQVVLSNQDAHVQRNYYIQACTVRDACSSLTTCTVDPVLDTVTKREPNVIVVITGVIVPVTAVIFAFCLWKKWLSSGQSSSSYSPMRLPERISGVQPLQTDWTDSSSTSSFEPYYSFISCDSENVERT